MKLNNLLGYTGLLAMLAGLLFLFLPAAMMGIFGLATDEAGTLMARYFGGAFLAFGVVIWFIRPAIDEGEHRAILLPLVICGLIGAAITLFGQFSGGVNALGWIVMVVFVLFSAGYGWMLANPKG
jgi:hypothetical protein